LNFKNLSILQNVHFKPIAQYFSQNRYYILFFFFLKEPKFNFFIVRNSFLENIQKDIIKCKLTRAKWLAEIFNKFLVNKNIVNGNGLFPVLIDRCQKEISQEIILSILRMESFCQVLVFFFQVEIEWLELSIKANIYNFCGLL